MSKPLKIVTFGGGTGAPTIIRSLVNAGFSHISAISASMDSGGKTGFIRSDERDRVIAISDLLRNLLALIPSNQNHSSQITAFTDLASFTDGRNRNLGYVLYYALLEKYQDDFIQVQNHLEQLLGIKFSGTAIPVTLKPTNIVFKTRSGDTFFGEHELDRQSMSTNTITKVWLDQPADATPQAINAITNATHIIFCPGSIYGSVLSNLLPKGITQALKATKATKIYVSNLVSDRNQTHQFTPLDFFDLFAKYTKIQKPFDVFICPNQSQAEFEASHPDIADHYATEHSHFHGWEKYLLDQLANKGVKVIPTKILSITPQLNRIRHDTNQLSTVFKQLLQTVK